MLFTLFCKIISLSFAFYIIVYYICITVKGNIARHRGKTIIKMEKVTLKQVGIMQEVAIAKEAFANSNVRLCEQRDVLRLIEETGGSFRDCLIEETRVWAAQLGEQDVQYWKGCLPSQFLVSEAEYFFGWVADYLYGSGQWFKLMKEVWNA